MTLFESGQIDEAENSFGELLSAAAEAEDAEFAARASNNLGVLANVRGDGALALTCYERALAAYQRLGQLRGLAQTHHNLGISYRDLGRIEEADAHYLRAIDYAGRAQSEDVIALAETERAVVRIRSGDAPMAEQFALRALARFERLGDPVRSAEAERVLAEAARAAGRLEVARERLERAFAVAQLHANLLLRAEVQRDRGELLHQLGQRDAARTAFTDAAEHFGRLGNTAEAERLLARGRSIWEGESGSEPTLNGETK
jgi:tetratricopeptide (TPR) repeat protein